MLVKEAGILRWSIGVRNRVDASLDVYRGLMQRIRGGYITYPMGFRGDPLGFGTGSMRRLTYPEGLCNVSGVVRRRSVGVRNRVDASLDVYRGLMQRIRGGYITYPEWFGTYPTGFGTGSMRRWTYPE